VSPSLPSTLYFVVLNRANRIYGYTWRIGTTGTSFYLKARAKPLGAVKISLHGPDPRPDLAPPGFKLAIDQSALPGVAAAQGAVTGLEPGQDVWFPGRAVTSKVTHVITFRYTYDLFMADVPSGPNPGEVDEFKQRGLILAAPSMLQTTEVDVFISDGAPFWQNSVQAFKDNACFGPIRNKAGQFLTCESMRRPIAQAPDIPKPNPLSIEDRTRGIHAFLDTRGVLQIQELWMSRSFFPEHHRLRATPETPLDRVNTAQVKAPNKRRPRLR
jgi:hypothetical protein